ncbi:MAG: hypothetical protein ACI86S_000391 [Paracoccaceae bacterium]|jgi:hypothetical protein
MVFSLPFLPLGDPAVDQYVRSKLFEQPAIFADMERWNAMPYLTGLLPQYEVLGDGDAPTELSAWVLNKTAYDALPEQYQTLLMDLRQMGMDIGQAEYAEEAQNQ